MPRRATRPPPLLAEFDDEEREAVLSANRAFYRAFTERDAEAMDQIWAPTGAVVCLHPGQAPLHERAEIMASWRAILRHPEAPKVRCIDEWVVGRPGLGHRGVPRDPGRRPAHGDQHVRAPERRLAHDRPSFRSGAADRDRSDDEGARPGADARPTQAALARWRPATPVARLLMLFWTASVSLA